MAPILSKKKYRIELFKTIPGRKEVEYAIDHFSPIGKRAIIGANWSKPFRCSVCEDLHPIIHVIHRPSRGRVGKFLVFLYSNELHLLDGSHPKGMDKLPNGNKELSQRESERVWHKGGKR